MRRNSTNNSAIITLSISALAVMAFLFFGCEAATQSDADNSLVLAENGLTSYSIVIGSDAEEAEKYAAKELAHFLEKMTGAVFPIKGDDASVSDFEIVLGETNRKSLSEVPSDLHPKAWEGFVILPEEGSLYIMGGQIARGTLYGVYDFLEEELGVRFVAPEVNHVPRKPTLEVRVSARSYDPPFEYRAHYPPQNPRYGYSEWATRNRVNSFGVGSGSVRRVGHPVHTFAYLVPPGQYFDEHPEYFALINGKRNSGTLCLTNPDTIRIATETARGWAKQAGTDPDTKYIVQVSINDSGAYCQCPKCAAVDKEEGVPLSGAMIRFVNAVARNLADEFPNVYVDTLAYMTSEAPPKRTKAAPNVIIWMAPIRKDSGRPVTEPQVNYDRNLGELAQRTSDIPDDLKKLETYENLRGWIHISKNVYIWDYPQSFHDFLVPYPSLWPVCENIRIFAEMGVKGYFPQQTNSDGGEMRYLRNYMISRQQWRPERDPRKSVEEFCQLYYGSRAGAEILRYIDFLHESWAKENRPLWWGGFKDDRFVPAANRILAKASELAGTKEHRERVAEFRLPIWRLILTQAFGEAGRTKSLPEQWWYRADDGDRGKKGQWHKTTDFSGWEKVKIPTRLYGTGGGQGAGWYGVTFDMPETKARLALHFGAMNGVWDVYVDGDQVAEQMPSGLGNYQEVPYVLLEKGLVVGRHTIVVRVKDGTGFYKLLQSENPKFTTVDPVTIVDMSKPLSAELRAAAEGFLSASRKAGMMRIFYGYSTPDPYLERLLRPKISFLLTHGRQE